MKELNRLVTIILLGLSLQVAIPSISAAADFRLIVNEASPVKSLRSEEVQRFMLGKSTKWAHGVQVQPVDQAPNSSTRAAFSREVLNKSVSAVKGYWQSQIFSGRGVPPAELQSDTAVIDFVRRNPGAIGYVSAGATLDGVKAVELD